jgi:Domain of unknown function (DUF4139)/N-terminal domain of unknown function (DUF4140)
MSAARRITARCLEPVLFLLATITFVVAVRAADDSPAAGLAITARAKEDAKAKDESYSTKGRLDEVTVYRGQALVTRLVEVPGPAGLREVVVSDLPDHVQPASIYAESADGVEVRSVLYRIRPVEQDVREEVRKLDGQIRSVQDAVQTNQAQTTLQTTEQAYLNKLEQFIAPTATAELTKGVLNAETLKALSTFLFDQRQKTSAEVLKLTFELRDLNDKLGTLNRQREVLTGGSAKTIREAVVFVNLKEANGKLRLRYLVDGASWSPSYNARTDSKHKQVTIEYNASIQQMTGEDWNNVAMSLSTATPSLVAKAPVLEPLTIALSAVPQAGPAGAKGSAAYLSAKKEIEEKRRQVEFNRNFAGNSGQFGANTFNSATVINGPAASGGAGGLNGSMPAQQPASQPANPSDAVQQQLATESFDETLNDVARESQVLDLVLTAKVERPAKPTREADGEGVSVSYQLDGRTSLPSRADRQLIQIASLPMKGEFYRVAIPVLTSAVYEEADIVNTSPRVLLAGPVSTYVDGQFVGHGDMPTVSIGESFTVGLGIDTSLRARRELVKKNESIQGGNRVVDFTYQLSIENFGAEAAQVRLMDRLPTAKETEVKLALVAPGQPLSEDPKFLQQDRKKGMLRWDVKVPAQAIGTKAFTLDYQMQMEYDKQLSIAGLPAKR